MKDKKKKAIIICSIIVLVILGFLMFIIKLSPKELVVQEIYDFDSGLALVKINNKYGYVDKSGKFAIKPQFSYAQSFRDGFAMVCEEKEGKHICGFINQKGKVIIDLKYEYGSSDYSGYSKISDVEDGLIMVRNKDKEAVFDTNGKKLSSFMKDISLSGDGLVSIWTDDSCTIVDPKNNMKPITKEKFNATTGCKNGICYICKYVDKESHDTVCGGMDYKGNIVINYSYDIFYVFNKDGIAVAKRKIDNKNKYGLINKKGLFVVEPVYEFSISGFYESEGFMFQKDEKTIVAFDSRGKEMFTLKGDYEVSGDFFDGFAKITKNIPNSHERQTFYVNEKGTVKFGPYEEGNNFSDGLAYIKEDKDKFFFIDTNGKKVITGRIENNE